MADTETSQSGADAAPSRLPIWRVGWLAGGLALGTALAAGALALGFAWLTRPAPDETPLRTANIATVDRLADHLVSRFGAPVGALRRLADRFAENDLGPDDTFAVTEALGATLAAAPGLEEIAYIDQQLRVTESRRVRGDIEYALGDRAADREAIQRLTEVQSGGPGSSLWGPVVYSGEDDHLTSRLAVPVFRDNAPFGMLEGRVVLPEIADSPVAAGAATPFILIGTDYVQYHPRLAPPEGGRARTATPVSELGDPVVAMLAERVAAGADIPERLSAGSGEMLVRLRELPGPGGEAWYVGVYSPVPARPGPETFLPIAALLGGLALLALVIGLTAGGRIDRSLGKQAHAISSAAALKLGPRPRLPRSAIRGVEAVNHAIARLGSRMEDIAALDPAPEGPAPALITGQVLRPRRGEALVVWIDATLSGDPKPAASAAVAINAELGLIADRIELEGGLAIPSGHAMAGIWFVPEDGDDAHGRETDADATPEPPADIARLARELVSIAGRAGEDADARALFAAGVGRGEVVLAEFGPPRRKRFAITGPGADVARRLAQEAAQTPTGVRLRLAEELELQGTDRADDTEVTEGMEADAAGTAPETVSPAADPTDR